uniref:Uncharacterized protein n=1 Tax=Knipowitschia caucasica TaxID=637954 RepID=A0AAV2MDW3_KNICA
MAARLPASELDCGAGSSTFGSTENTATCVLVPSVSSVPLSPAGVLVPSVSSVPLSPAGVLVPSVSSGLKQENPESPQISEEPEEHGIKLEEDLLQITVGVKAEEHSLLQEIPQSPQTKEEPEEVRIKHEEEPLQKSGHCLKDKVSTERRHREKTSAQSLRETQSTPLTTTRMKTFIFSLCPQRQMMMETTTTESPMFGSVGNTALSSCVLVPSVSSVPLSPAGVLVPSVSSGLKQENPESPQISEEPEEHGIKLEEDLLQITVGVKAEEHSLLQEIPQSPQTKEEPEEVRIKHEEEPLPVCVKTEEWSLPQRQSEHREETQGEDISPESEGDTEHSSDHHQDEDLQPLSSDDDEDGDEDGDADSDHRNTVTSRLWVSPRAALRPRKYAPPATTVPSAPRPPASTQASFLVGIYELFITSLSPWLACTQQLDGPTL